MNEIKDVKEYCVTGEFSIAASVRADGDSEEKKSVTLKFKMDQTPLSEVIGSALKDKRINWQSGARKVFNSIPDGGTIVVDFKGGRQPVDTKEKAKSIIAGELANLSDEEKLSWLKENGLL